MAGEINTPIDINDWPETAREAAEEVHRTKRPRLIKRGDQEIAVLSPVAAATEKPRRSRARGTKPNAWLSGLVGIATSTDGVTDVSRNKHKYLADAYANTHTDKEQ
jgi:hypothetical protein